MKHRRLRQGIGAGLLAVLALGAAAQAPTVVRGRLAAGSGALLLLLRPQSPLERRPDTTRIVVAASGEFAAVLPAAGGSEAVLQIGQQELPLWLEPGDTLTLQLDARHPAQATLRGRTAGVSYYRWAQQRQHTDNFYDAPEGRHDARDPATHRQRADAYRRRAEEVLRQSHARHPLPPARYRQAAQVIRYEWGRVLLALPYRYEYERPYQGRVLRPLPEAYYAFVPELPLQDSLLGYAHYRGYAALYPQYTLRARRQQVTFAENISRQFALAYDTVASSWPTSATRDYVLAQQLHDLLQHGADADVAPRLTDFPARTTNPVLRAAVARRAALRQHTAPGQWPPAFQLRDEKGQPADLAALKGKVVYLDFWASWCKPCREEQPALRALRQQFAGRAEVVFVGISIDARAADWQRALAREPAGDPMPQVQLIGQPGDAALHQLFEQGGVPQYWLLAPDGRILESHAPRPSNPNAQAAIEAALAAGRLSPAPK